MRFLPITAAVAVASSLFATPANALTGGTPVTDGSYPFVARVEMSGARACTGALVSPFWIVTSKSCFVDDGQALSSGAPPQATTVTVGRADLTGSAGRVIPVTSLVVHPDRDVVLAKLAAQVTGIAPVAVSGAAPAAGEPLRTAGYGRTGTEWVPNDLRSAPVTVGSVAIGSFEWAGQDAATTACQGDGGGPVFRDSGGRPELVGINVASGQGGCTGTSDGRHGATAARLDDLAAWIAAKSPGLTAGFGATFASGAGIGGYSLTNPNDKVVAFDYDHSGKQDHIVLYRPGQGAIYILKHNNDNSFTRVYATASGGIGGFSLTDPQDKIIPFDYDHSGRLDHLLLYRPGQGAVYILKHNNDNSFTRVYATASGGIGGYNLTSPNDQVVAFDYDHSGKPDHLLLYRPGSRTAWILQHNADGSWRRVYNDNTNGIGGYDLAATTDRIIAFDYDHSGKLDHLVAYRPGAKTAFIVKHRADGTFGSVYATTTQGIGGFNLSDPNDQILAYDYDHSGRPDHLATYRPGSRIVWILEHGSGNSFAKVYASNTDGIGGYNMGVPQDRLVAFDFEHTGSNDHLIAYRPSYGTIWIIGRQWAQATPASTGAPGGGTLPDGSGTPIVETYRYPGAAEILASLNVRLIGGDGHIVLADCTTAPVNDIGVIRVWTTEPIGTDGGAQICFTVTAPTGRLDLEVPGVFEIRGDGQRPGAGHALTAVVKPDDGTAIAVPVNPSGSTQVGIGADPDNAPTTLLQLRVPG